jgi:ABC-2 type transport system ATP-binding protein
MTETGFAVEASGLGKRYRKQWALQECTFSVPTGSIAALIGPNGAGKSTLLRMLAGITTPTTGSARVVGGLPSDSDRLGRVGYLDQERPLYRGFRVSEMLRYGRELNPRWDDERAQQYLDELQIPRHSRIKDLSGGQQAQVALTMCLAKRPELLLLDEPAGSLDPLARDNLMHLLLGSVVDDGTTVLLSSHAVADLATACDYVVILNSSRLQLAEPLDRVLSTHRILIGPTGTTTIAPDGIAIVSSTSTDRQTTMLVRSEQPVVASSWDVLEPTLEEVVLAYLRRQSDSAAPQVVSTASGDGASIMWEAGTR